MQIFVCENYEEMSDKAADLIVSGIKKKPDGLISFPGGETPVGFISRFTQMVNHNEIDISKLKFVSLDEWVGLSGNDTGSCAKFLQDNLFAQLEHPFADVFILNGAAADIEAECRLQKSFIDKNGPLTVSVLGIGLNGHLGFNEDGVDFDLESHIIPLSPTTKSVMSKYFNGKQLPLTQGITQGIRQIMNSDQVILIANGVGKAEILKSALQGPVTNRIPASILQKHHDCCVVIDKAAAAKL
jgi:glucosamine-6-phosphate isomerase